MKNKFHLLLLMGVWLLAMPGCQQDFPRPNILLIMCDDLGWGDTGFNGNQKIRTPHMDEMASSGIILRRFYSASPVCSPTRASCLTGRSPYRMGIPTANSGHMKVEEITLPEILKGEGYLTGHFGKWHLGTLTTRLRDANRGRPGDSTHYSIPSMHGYDDWFVTESKVPTWDPMIKPVSFDTAIGESLRYGWSNIPSDAQSEVYGTYYWKGEELFETENLLGDDARIITDRLIPFMEKAAVQGQPFFSAVWFHTPHLPVVADPLHRNIYADLSHEEQLYYGTITAMDEQIGRIWRKLEELDLADNTIIWFCSDNGPERGTPGSSGPFRERKRSLHEGGVRVPAFVCWPGMAGGQETDFPMFTSDYLPTLLEYTGIPYTGKRPVDGISLLEVIKGNQRSGRTSPMGFRHGNKMSWVTHEYKLISKDDGESFELYNLLRDQEEAQNIAAEQPERVVEMKSALMAWIASCERSEAGEDY